MRKGIERLVAKARENLALARKYRALREYATARMLYAKAVEGILRAMVISKTNRPPPREASIEYLFRKAGVGGDAEYEMMGVSELSAEAIGSYPEAAGYGDGAAATGESADGRLTGTDIAARALLDYFMTYVSR